MRVSRAFIFNPKTYTYGIVDDRLYDVDRGGKLNFSINSGSEHGKAK